jgi:hypothetical protein
MIHKHPSPFSGHIRVTFELPASIWADRICLVGEFNNWNPCATPLHCTRSGIWRVTLDLPAGQRYEFRYLIDNHWCTDHHADGCTIGAHHAVNSYVDTVLPPEPYNDGSGPSLVHNARSAQGAEPHETQVAGKQIRPRTPENGRARKHAGTVTPVDAEENQPVQAIPEPSR